MWMNELIAYLFFNLKIISIVTAIVIVLCAILILLVKTKSTQNTTKLIVKDVYKEYLHKKDSILKHIMTNKLYKERLKQQQKILKNTDKAKRNNLFILSFSGDIQASQLETLREEVTAILSVAKKNDEVIVKLESSGGVVNNYGLAASQLARIRNANITLTVCVDSVAASGGYMMACVAHKIICAPFAIVGINWGCWPSAEHTSFS